MIAGLYKEGSDESIEEVVILETDDLTEAQDLLAELGEEESGEDDGAEDEEETEEEEEVA